MKLLKCLLLFVVLEVIVMCSAWAQQGPSTIGPAGAITQLPLLPGQGGSGSTSYGGVVFGNAGTLSTTGGPTTNEAFMVGWYQNAPFTLASDMRVGIPTADASHNSDWGIYYCPTAPASGGTTTCNLIEDVGANENASTGIIKLNWMTNASCTASVTPGGLCTGSGTGTYPTLPVNEPAGYWILALTSASNSIRINYGSNATTDLGWFAVVSNNGSTTGGVLNATVTSPAFTPGTGKPIGALD